MNSSTPSPVPKPHRPGRQGRPPRRRHHPVPGQRKRDTKVHIWAHSDQKAAWEAKARALGMTFSDYTRGLLDNGDPGTVERLRNLLIRCRGELEYVRRRYDDFKPQLMADLERELGPAQEG